MTGFRELGTKLRNWRRWGPDDELGTVNFITPTSRKRGAEAVRSGTTVDLGMPFDISGPQSGGMRFNPIHKMTRLLSDGEFSGLAVADDIVIMPLQCATQWDSLAHVAYDSRAYNDMPYSAVTASEGATRNSFATVAPHLVGRGVLLDIPALKGVSCLAATDEVTGDDLAAAAARQNVRVEQGDIVLVRTGWYQKFLAGDIAGYMGEPHPGLGLSCCNWLYDNQVAAVTCDNFAVEVRPSRDPDAGLPFHMVAIRDMGLTLGEMFNLEGLAAACAERGAWDFLFAGPGLKITGSVGSPITPVAVL
jgi:kynurenine formamidase